jgi:dUTP pyrophosphatase
MKIEIINKSKHALPQYETSGAAGMDIRANIDTDIVLGSLDRIAVPTGLFIAVPLGYEAQIRPRSGMSLKHGIAVSNSPGTIDSDYRGEIKIILTNVSKDEFVIKDGDRIAQMVIAQHERADWTEVIELSSTERGAGGFGSTGGN